MRGHVSTAVLLGLIGAGAAMCGLAAVAVVSTSSCPSKPDRAKITIQTVGDLIKQYRLRHGAPPRSLNDLVVAQITDRVPTDPWGERLDYQLDGELSVVTSRGHGLRPDISSNDL